MAASEESEGRPPKPQLRLWIEWFTPERAKEILKYGPGWHEVEGVDRNE